MQFIKNNTRGINVANHLQGCLLGLLLFAFPTPSHPQDQPKPRPAFNNRGTPEEFLRDLYSRYNFADLESAPQLLNRDTKALADSSLQKLIIKEERLSNGDPGIIDSDMICDCQDFEKATLEKIELSNQTSNSVEAKVTFSLAENWTGYVQTYQLVKIDRQWRIHDVIYNHSQVNGNKCFTLIKTLKYAIGSYSKDK